MWLCSFGEPLHNGSIHIQCWIHVQDIWTALSYGFHIMLTLANIWSISSQNAPSVYLEEQEVFDSFRLGLAERVIFCLYRVELFLVLEAIFRSKKQQNIQDVQMNLSNIQMHDIGCYSFDMTPTKNVPY